MYKFVCVLRDIEAVVSGVTVPAGKTIFFDVDTVRATQKPDSQGQTIPLAAQFGKFHWLPLPGTRPKLGLNGRTELQSLSRRRASSFSCGSDCQYQYWAYPFFDNDLFAPYPDENTPNARASTMHDEYRDAYGNDSTHSVLVGAIDPPLDTEDHSILNFSSTNNDYTMVANTGAAGTTTYHYHFTRYDSYTSSTDDGNPEACTEEDDGYPEGGETTVQPTVKVTGASLYGNQLNVTLSGSSGENGPRGLLTIRLNNTSGGSWSYAYGSGPVGPGTYNISLNRTDIPVGKYRSITAEWAVSPGTVSGNFSITWDVYGVIRHSQYNTPTESGCGPATSQAWIINPASCSFSPVNLRSSFIGQTAQNGTGISINYGVLKYTPTQNQCTYPQGANSSNTFRQVGSVTGACNRTLNSATVATNPNPGTNNGHVFDCDNNLAYVTGSNITQAQKFFEDYCPACNAGFNGTNGHIDNYSDSQACSAGAVGDYGNFWTANTHDFN